MSYNYNYTIPYDFMYRFRLFFLNTISLSLNVCYSTVALIYTLYYFTIYPSILNVWSTQYSIVFSANHQDISEFNCGVDIQSMQILRYY